ncbi:MAG: uridine kinase [Cellulomonadaceae bacterium]|nr:uridine kinase [Cellulomonadaceae bacterium]
MLHADDFFNPADVRHSRGRLSAEGFWLDTYDYPALISWALEPLSRDGLGLYRSRSYDQSTGTTTRPDPTQAPKDALVIVEGTFLHRDEVVGFWDYSVYLDVSLDEANRRMRQREGLARGLGDGLLQRYNDAQRLYFAQARPWERATIVVDNTDPTAPAAIEPASAHAAS